MPKRKSADDQIIESCRKTLKEAPKRSLEYMEAKKTLEDLGASEEESDASYKPESGSEDAESASSEEASEEEDEDDDGEEEKKKSSKKVKKAKPPTSKEKKKDVKKEKPGKVESQKEKGKKKVVTVVKNYAPDEKNEENLLFYEAAIGAGYMVRLNKWLKNEKSYVQIRKNATAGAVVPTKFFDNLVKALNDIKERFPDQLEDQ